MFVAELTELCEAAGLYCSEIRPGVRRQHVTDFMHSDDISEAVAMSHFNGGMVLSEASGADKARRITHAIYFDARVSELATP